MKKINQYEKGFLEGIIDGEGCINLFKSTYTRAYKGFHPKITLTIANNNKKLLDKINLILYNTGCFIKKDKNYELRFGHTVLRWLLPQLRLINKEYRRNIAIKILRLLRKGDNQFSNKKYIKEKDRKIIKLVTEWK